MSGWVPVPREAIALCTSQLERAAVLDLYARAHALRWRSLRVTERSLCTSWEMSNRRIWSLLGDLEAAGLLRLDRGGNRVPTSILVRDPTSERGEHVESTQSLRQSGQQSGQHNERGETPASGESAAQSAAQDAATLSETREREHTTPSRVGGASEEWNRLAAAWRERHPGGPALSPSKGQGQLLKARLTEHGEAPVKRVLWWAHHSQHPRAVFLRERGLSLVTLLRASKFEEYLGFAAEEKPATPKLSPVLTTTPSVSDDEKAKLRAAIERRRDVGTA